MSFLRKQTPVWSLLLAGILGASSLTAAFLVVPQLSDAAQAARDYSITAAPSSLTVNQGSTATATITVASIEGFALATGLTALVSPGGTGWLAATLSLSVVTPSSGGRAGSTLTVTSLQGTPIGTYQVTISSSGGTKSHTTTVSVTVAPADFTIMPTPSSLMVAQSGYNTTTLTVTSLAGFTGNVSLSSTTPLAYLAVWGSPSPVNLVPGGSATSLLTVSASPQTSPGTYTVTVTGTAGALTHSVNIAVEVKASSGCGCCACGTEALNLESYAFNSNTNVTLYLRNTGSANITLLTYYVRDTSGDQYSNTVWNGPTINTNNVAATVILIGSSCPSCTLAGSAFTFTSGNAYTITVVTSRNSQFVFTIVR